MLIGLVGYAQSGKDSVGDILKDGGFQRVSFADKLREFALAVDPFVECEGVGGVYYLRLSRVVAVCGWDAAKVENPDVRTLLQRLGTEGGRQTLYENVWVDAAFNDVDTTFDDIVVTDVRFPNEVEEIRARGGVLWRVIRPGTGPVNAHASETAVDHIPADADIHNCGTLDDLRATVLNAL